MLRAVVYLSCIMFAMKAKGARPSLILTVVPAAAAAIYIGSIECKPRFRWAGLVAAAIDTLLITTIVHSGGGLASDAFFLFVISLVAASLHESVIPCSALGMIMAAAYFGASYSSWRSGMWPAWILPYRCALLVFASCGIGLLAQAFQRSVAWVEAERTRVERQARWDRVVANIAREIGSGLALTPTLELILDGGLAVLEVSAGLIALRDRQGRFMVRASRNAPSAVQGRFIEPGDGAIGRAIELRTTIITADYRSDSGSIPEFIEAGVSSALAAPLFAGSELMGAISFGNTREGAVFAAEDREFLESLAKQLSVVVANIWLLEDARRREEYLSILSQISHGIVAVLEPEALFEKIYREVSRVLMAEAFFVALYHAKEGEFEMAFAMDRGERYPIERHPVGVGLTGRVIMSGEPILVSSVQGGAVEGSINIGNVEDGNTRSILIVPMKIGSRVIGAISAQSYVANAFGEAELELLTTIAATAAVAVENARLYQRARELSLTDDLTGLGNYRFFGDILEKEMEQAKRRGGIVSLVMLDSDSLKFVNDRYGHVYGDLHLKELARSVEAIIRKSDIAARYAGDEFMVILPDTDLRDAAIMAERLRTRVENSPLHIDGEPVTTTVSIGVVSYPVAGATVDELTKAVDCAMYKAKRGGKNRVALG
ncbi:MAG: sensor domain-containing diguanylate cyclase [Clostridia bacterium]|nr:sensor domain-containing diguanylate cyclase [Clostridia bacterium]